jgi:hypothetical protein
MAEAARRHSAVGLFTAIAAIAVLLAAAGCHSRGPSTCTMVYNLSLSTFQVEEHQVEVHASRSVYTVNGAIDTFDLTRGAVIGRLVITSLLAAGDPDDYDAAVNVHEDTPGVLYCREYSPYIDAVIVAP